MSGHSSPRPRWAPFASFALGLALCSGAVLLPSAGSARGFTQDTEQGDVAAPAYMLVAPRAGVGDADFAAALRAQGLEPLGRLQRVGVVVAEVRQGGPHAARARLAAHPYVRFVEPDALVEVAGAPSDPYYSSEWHLTRIQAPVAWNSSTGAGVVIAVLDTGVDGTHPDLASQLVPGWNLVDGNADTSDVYGHGTAVAGTAAAAANNGTGVASVAYGARIMPVRIADARGTAWLSTIVDGITWAADHGARVINVSFSGVAGSPSIFAAASYARSKGGVVVVSAGNSGVKESYPESDQVLAVSATDSRDARPRWSSYGTYVDLAAPGVSILTTSRGGGYGWWSGTSFSSPIVAGVMALLFARQPTLAPAEVDAIVRTTARDLGTAGWDMFYGTGRVDAGAAVQAGSGPLPAADVAPPVVAFTAPGDGATVSGLVSLGAVASDDRGVALVEFSVNGNTVASLGSAPYAAAWDSTSLPDGAVTLTVRARDEAGNVASASIAVTVANSAAGPSPSPGTPGSGGSFRRGRSGR